MAIGVTALKNLTSDLPGYLCVYGVAVVDYVDSLVGGVGLAGWVGGYGEAQAVVMWFVLSAGVMMAGLEWALLWLFNIS
jgi:hypothetical protein